MKISRISLTIAFALTPFMSIVADENAPRAIPVYETFSLPPQQSLNEYFIVKANSQAELVKAPIPANEISEILYLGQGPAEQFKSKIGQYFYVKFKNDQNEHKANGQLVFVNHSTFAGIKGQRALPFKSLTSNDIQALAGPPTESDKETTPPISSTSPEIPQRDKPPKAVENTNKCKIAITFDDGPSPYTPKLLEYLQGEKIPATFYPVSDRLETYKGSAKIIAEDPLFFMGNHTKNHSNLTTLSKEEIREEVRSIRSYKIYKTALQNQDGKESFRCPGGASNKLVLEVLKEEGINHHCNWNVDPQDWKRPGIEVITNRVVNETVRQCKENPSKGVVILLHDLHQASVEAVPGIVENIRKQLGDDFEFVTIDKINPINTTSIKWVDGAKEAALEEYRHRGEWKSNVPQK